MASILGYAVIDVSGRVDHQSGLQSINHVGPGHWQLFFDFSVANACEVASLGEQVAEVFIAAYGEPVIAENEVTVRTYAGSLEVGRDATFQLIVVQ
jgi:hypothetical protein